MEKRNIVEEGRTPGFVKHAAAPDDFEKKAKDAFAGFRPRKPAENKSGKKPD
jgi:hypothetical protein